MNKPDKNGWITAGPKKVSKPAVDDNGTIESKSAKKNRKRNKKKKIENGKKAYIPPYLRGNNDGSGMKKKV
jgi:hypothetical protein